MKARPRPKPNMNNHEIEQYLGMMYAETLKDNKDAMEIYKDCEEVIHGSLDLLQRYNKIRLNMASKLLGQPPGGDVFT